MKTFILIYKFDELPRQEMLDFLDTMPDLIPNWRSIELAIFIASDNTAVEIAKKIHEKFPKLWHFITEVAPGNKQGWIDKPSWEFINNPKPVD